jgi:hypothetical protein
VIAILETVGRRSVNEMQETLADARTIRPSPELPGLIKGVRNQ